VKSLRAVTIDSSAKIVFCAAVCWACKWWLTVQTTGPERSSSSLSGICLIPKSIGSGVLCLASSTCRILLPPLHLPPRPDAGSAAAPASLFDPPLLLSRVRVVRLFECSSCNRHRSQMSGSKFLARLLTSTISRISPGRLFNQLLQDGNFSCNGFVFSGDIFDCAYFIDW
jgi:hypothetical protein